jgi:hypothetical protein
MSKDIQKLFLSWYYNNLMSISKSQARYAWIIFILSMLARTINTAKDQAPIKMPIINIPLQINVVFVLLPIALSFIFWAFFGTSRAIRISINNMKYRLKQLGYNPDDLKLYDIDTDLNPFDFITFNFRKYEEPGGKIESHRFNWRHLPYLSFIIFYYYVKIFIIHKYPVNIIFKIIFIILIILDVIFSCDFISRRIKKFFVGVKDK